MTGTAATTTIDSSKPKNSSFSLNSVNITAAINMKTSTLTSERQSTIPLLRITSYSIINQTETTTPLAVSETTVPISPPSLLSLPSSSSSKFSTLSPTFLPSSSSSSPSSKSPILTHLFSSSFLLSTISPSPQKILFPAPLASSSSLSPLIRWNNNTATAARLPPSPKNNNSSIFQQRLAAHQLPSLSATTSLTTNKTTIRSTGPTLAPSPRQVTTIPIQTNRTTATIITSNKRPTIIIYPTVSPESIVIPIVSCILGFPLLALMIICCLRRRAKLARERDRRRNYDMQDHAVSLVRFSPIHRLNNRSSRAISLRPERSLSRGFPSLELDTVIEERSDPEQTQTDIISPESPLDPNKFRDFNSS